MKIIKHRNFYISLWLFCSVFYYSSVAQANSNFNDVLWKDIPVVANKSEGDTHISDLKQSLASYRQLYFDEARFKSRFAKPSASRSVTVDSNGDTSDSLDIPLPDGTSLQVKLEQADVMAPQLAAKYPDIKTWKAVAISNPAINGRVDITRYGLHVMMMLENGETVFVERDTLNSVGVYKSFSKQANPDSFKHTFQCSLHEHNATSMSHDLPVLQKIAVEKQALPLIKYRLAVATTGEYTKFHGGSVSKALSAIVTTINRVNEINERDLGITLELIPQEDSLIYTDPDTDPYTNNDASAMLEENILNLSADGILDESQFDIGHVFGQGGYAGFAFLESACDDFYKAGGVTGSPNPRGNAFDIDFVAHELGHQIGATHTFNSQTLSCGGDNRNEGTAVEPGSGSTIMAYAGICGSNNLQQFSDAQYHAVSIKQIQKYTRTAGSTGNSCGSKISTVNQAPVADAQSDYFIPANTPFLLSGSANDADQDQLIFSWDQVDSGMASNVNVDTGDNAIIRSRLPTLSPQRYIPNLQNLFGQTQAIGEILPQTQRELNFVLTARDGKGSVSSDDMKISVQNTGNPFSVTSHQYSQTLLTGETTTVNWNVAGTNQAPISCASVDIRLLTVNGKSTLIEQTDNDGAETITIPSDVSSMNAARIMVKCSDGLFFNISPANLTITGQSDTEAPVITLQGFNPEKIIVGGTYVEKGALADDDFDTDVSVTITGIVDTNTEGSYELIYSAVDDSGNEASVTRTVNVVAETVKQPESVNKGGGGSLKFPLLFILMLIAGIKYGRKPGV